MNCVSLREQKRATKMKRGFTLIELMIVMAVIAILAGIALPHFKGMQDEGKTIEAAGELRTLATAIESYYIHNSKEYPNQQVAVDSVWQTASICAASPAIVKTALADPFKPAQEYSYCTSAATSGSQYYIVFSVGADGVTTITAITTAGAITGAVGDDIYITNGEAGTGGF